MEEDRDNKGARASALLSPLQASAHCSPPAGAWTPAPAPATTTAAATFGASAPPLPAAPVTAFHAETPQSQRPPSQAGGGRKRGRSSGGGGGGSGEKGRGAGREREISLQELGQHFDKPIEEAARAIGVCSTLLKKVCRRHDIKRWPYRQVKSLDRTLDCLRMAAAGAAVQPHPDPAEQARIRSQIEALESRRAALVKQQVTMLLGNAAAAAGGLEEEGRPSSATSDASSVASFMDGPAAAAAAVASPGAVGEGCSGFGPGAARTYSFMMCAYGYVVPSIMSRVY